MLHEETAFLAILSGLGGSFQLSPLAESRILAKETKGKGASSQLVIKNDCRVKDVNYLIWLTFGCDPTPICGRIAGLEHMEF